jgi:hypothetical protein
MTLSAIVTGIAMFTTGNGDREPTARIMRLLIMWLIRVA